MSIEKKDVIEKIDVLLLTEKEAARYIGMSVTFLQHGRSNGTLGNRTPTPKFKKIGSSVRYDKRDLDDWVDSFKSVSNLAELAF